jgi:DNA-binding GntR family transcriptional regulator
MLNGLRNEINKETWVETLEHHKLIYRAIMEENTDEIANAYNFHLNYYLSSALRTIRNLSTNT